MLDFPERSMATTFSALSSSSDFSMRPRSFFDAAGVFGPALALRAMGITLWLLRSCSLTGVARSRQPRSGDSGQGARAQQPKGDAHRTQSQGRTENNRKGGQKPQWERGERFV